MKMSNTPARYEVPVKQYLRSILNISETSEKNFNKDVDVDTEFEFLYEYIE